MKNYFSHDFDASLDEKCAALLMKHGVAGYGLFWRIIERLANESNHTHIADYNLIAYDMRCPNSMVKSVVEDFGLFAFTEDGKRFYSESLMRRMRRMDEISAKRKQAAHSRWDDKNANASEIGCKCNANASKNDANAMQMHTNFDAKERRRKEMRLEEKKGERESRAQEAPSPSDFQNHFSVFLSAWDTLANDENAPVKAAKRKWNKMNTPDSVIRNYLARCQEYGEATVLAAIDQLRNAKFWHGKTIGLPTMLDEQKFQKLIDGEYDNLFAKPDGSSKSDKSKGCVPVHEADQKKFDEWDSTKKF